MTAGSNVGPPPSDLSTKECPRARLAQEHKPHVWFKEGRPQWRWHCDGILPIDQQPPCQWYISPERPECGEPSPTTIRVKTKLIDARIDVCTGHKAIYDNHSARMRAERNTLPRAS